MTRRAWTAFAVASIVWGVPYLFIKIAVDHGVTAPVLAWGRVTLGALVLLALAWRAGTLGSLRGRWRWLLAFAVAEIVIPFPMLAIGEERVTSSLAAIMVATVPLIGAVLAMRFDRRLAVHRRPPASRARADFRPAARRFTGCRAPRAQHPANVATDYGAGTAVRLAVGKLRGTPRVTALWRPALGRPDTGGAQ